MLERVKEMGKRFLTISIIFLVIFTGFNPAYAADAFYRLTHNDHDALVIGQIIAVSENNITLEIKKQIISTADLNVSDPKKQIPLQGVIEVRNPGDYIYLQGSEATPQIGDYVLISINKKGKSFAMAWGMYKVDSLDYKSLNVLYTEGASHFVIMDTVALKAFINSDGEKNNFSFDSSKGIVYSDGEIIYNANLISDESSNIIKDGENPNPITEIEDGKDYNKRFVIVITGTLLSVFFIASLVILRKKRTIKP